MHKYRRIFRLYNHAQILASDIGKYTGKKVMSDILLKIKNTKPQSSLSKQERIKNLSGAFHINKGQYIKNKKILLIDDVVTTGITASICAGKLKKAGAKKVVLLSIARRML
jgi:ComF family protein